MWNTSTSGGFGNKTGGGFLSSQNASPSTFNTSSEKRKPDRINNIVPCTIAHLLKTPETEDHVRIGSMIANMVTIVGIVRSIDEQSTKATYFVDDMTAEPIEVQMWLGGEKEGSSNEKRLSIVEDCYIRVTGALRFIKGKRLINSFKVVPVKNMNELTMHFLEIIHASMAVAVMDKQQSEKLEITKFPRSDIKSEINSSYGVSGENKTSISLGMTKTQQIVFQAISSCTTDKGVNYDYLYSSIKSFNRQTIKETVDFLSNEGHIYSTIDDEHFKSTDSVCD